MVRRPRIPLFLLALLAAALPRPVAGAQDPACDRAVPYRIVTSALEVTPSGRRCLRLDVAAATATREQHAHTLIRAARDAEEVSGADLVSVSLYPTPDLAGFGPRTAYGFFAPDGRAAAGLPGADPAFRRAWRVYAADRAPTDRELRIARLWRGWAPHFPSRQPWSACMTDLPALRARVARELGVPAADVTEPALPLRLFLERRPS